MPRRASLVTALALASVVTGPLSGRAGAPPTFAPDDGVRSRAVSVRDSPGYVPLVDPESTSVLLGRRLNAPAVSKPFRGGARSLDDLGRTICRVLHRSDRDSLLALCITDEEFRDILWREFPQSRPAVGLTWVDAWRILYARLHAGCMHALRDQGGHVYEFVGFDRDSTARYRNFKLYSGLTLVVRDDEGGIQRWRWLRSIAERGGRFKIYSTDD
jgi:hypothetical protein